MVILLIIRPSDEDIELTVCCAAHAREYALTNFADRWWEVLDQSGQMVDSADNAAEGNKPCS